MEIGDQAEGRYIKVDADPSMIIHAFQYAMACGEIYLTLTEIESAVIEAGLF